MFSEFAAYFRRRSGAGADSELCAAVLKTEPTFIGDSLRSIALGRAFLQKATGPLLSSQLMLLNTA